MKSPILLACALITAMTLSGVAHDQTPAAEAGKPKQVRGERAGRGERANRGPLTEEQRKKMMDKRMEHIKEKDAALHKDLSELREKDPAAFRARMREMGRVRAQAAKQNAGQGIGRGKGQGQGQGQGPGKEPKAEKPVEAKADL